MATSGDWEAKATAPTAGRIAIHKAMIAARTPRIVNMREVCTFNRDISNTAALRAQNFRDAR